jgi:hypothetical protein
MKQDKQPRRPSKQDVSTDKLQPASDMNARAAGGDKEGNEPLRRRQKSSGAETTPSRKPRR